MAFAMVGCIPTLPSSKKYLLVSPNQTVFGGVFMWRWALIFEWVKEWFARHELWALGMAERWHVLAMFFAATLWIWIVPFVPLLTIFTLLMNEAPISMALPNLVLGLGLLFFVTPWFFRWYFICVGLMFGKTGMATAKRKQINQRLMSP